MTSPTSRLLPLPRGTVAGVPLSLCLHLFHQRELDKRRVIADFVDRTDEDRLRIRVSSFVSVAEFADIAICAALPVTPPLRNSSKITVVDAADLRIAKI